MLYHEQNVKQNGEGSQTEFCGVTKYRVPVICKKEEKNIPFTYMCIMTYSQL